MKILVVHNPYQQAGGEDVVFEQKCRLLRRAGHQVITYCRSNDEIEKMGALQKLTTVPRAVWSSDAKRELEDLLERERPDVVHVHNTFAMISPSIYFACYAARIPVVQTLHNYRLMCPAATFYRAGQVCEDCTTGGLWQGIRHRCYHDSRGQTAVVASIIAVHRKLGTWAHPLHYYIALSQFARQKFIEAGLPETRLFVKPNFVDPDPGPCEDKQEYAVFVGRLSPEKQVGTLLRAWEKSSARMPLLIVGGGPQLEELRNLACKRNLNGIQFLGQVPRPEAVEKLRRARFLIFCSQWYENFPVTIVEAFASATPVICSRLGAMEEIVSDGRTGKHFTAGDADDLARSLDWAWTHPAELSAMGRAARAEFESLYSAEKNYSRLLQIYRRVIAEAGRRRPISSLAESQ